MKKIFNPLVPPFDSVPDNLTDIDTRPYSALTGYGTGVSTWLGTPSSANLLAAVTDETGTGALTFATSPTFTTDITTPKISGSGGLTIQGHSAINTNRVNIDDQIELLDTDRTFTTTTSNLINLGGTYTLNFATPSIGQMVGFNATVILNQNPGAGMGTLFNNSGTFKNGVGLGVTNLANVFAFINQPTFTADTNNQTISQMFPMIERGRYSVSGGATMALTTLDQITAGNSANAAGTVGSGVTITTRTGFRVKDLTGSGTLTTNIGIDVEALIKGSTNIGIRNAGVLRQTANAMFGADQAPTFAISLGGDAARTIGMERHSTANTAGNTLTVQAGGATLAATDKAGGALIVQTGIGTGSSKPARVDIQADAQGTAAGTTSHSQVTRIGINMVIQTLTSGVAATAVSIPLASGQMAGGTLLVTIEVSDGTDHITLTGGCHYSVVNKAGVFTSSTASILSATAKSEAADTIAVTFAIVGANPALLQLTPTITGIVPTIFRATGTVISNAQQDVTI